MSSQDSEEQDGGCLCKAFVPKEKRVDFIAPRPDKKTGVVKATVYLRYHQDCPIHGLNVRVGDARPYDPNNPNRTKRTNDYASRTQPPTV